MTWVNLDDVYVSTNGGTINGDLAVNGTLTCKNGSTTYNVGSQLATLGDSVSPADSTGVTLNSSFTSRQYSNNCTRIGNAVFICLNRETGNFSSWERWDVGTVPKPKTGGVLGLAILQSGSAAPSPLICGVDADGTMYLQNKSGITLNGGWLFVCFSYVCN